MAGPRPTTIDLRGRTVIPGLADGHLHDAGGGPGVDLLAPDRSPTCWPRCAARVAQSRPGDVIVTNSDWHEAQLKEQRLPYRKDLDRVSPATPGRRGPRRARVHPEFGGAREMEHHDETPRAAGGRITRDADGELNGELVDRAKVARQAARRRRGPSMRWSSSIARRERRRADQHPLSRRVNPSSTAAPGDGTRQT